MLEIEKMDMRSCSLLRLYPSKATTFELARRGGGLEHDLGFRALTTIRLVGKIICCSASKLVFRNIRVAFRDLDGSEALMRLEDIFNSPRATDVRKLDMLFCPQLFEGMDRHSGEFHDFFNKLRSLFKRLPNLEAFNHYPGAFDRQYEAFFNVAVRTVRSLPLRNLTELEISHHYYGYFHDPEEFHPMEPDSETPRGGLENLRHLDLKGRFLWE